MNKILTTLLTILVVGQVFAENKVLVQTLDEQYYSSNLTVLRFNVQNVSLNELHGLELHYYVTHDSSLLAAPEIYYMPNGNAHWSYDNGKTALIISFPNAILSSGDYLADESGFAIGLHALNWGLWDKKLSQN